MFVAQAQRATLVQLSLSFAIAACRKSICFAAAARCEGTGGKGAWPAAGCNAILTESCPQLIKMLIKCHR